MKTYITPELEALMLTKEDILNFSLEADETEGTFLGLAEGGKGTGTSIDFSLLG